MITTTYKCDKCGHTQDTDLNMWTLSIHTTCVNPYNPPFAARSVLWCRSCVLPTQLIYTRDGHDDAEGKPIPEPSFEELLKDLLRPMIEEIVESTRQ